MTLGRPEGIAPDSPAFPGRMDELAATHDPEQPVGRVRHPSGPGFPVVDGAFGDPQKLRSGGHGQVAGEAGVSVPGGFHGGDFPGFPGCFRCPYRISIISHNA